jgi:hypothetical protein
MSVNTPSAEYSAMLPKWKRVRDCVGGRDAVLAAGKDYLPELPGNPKGYEAYAKRGNFYNATKRTKEGLVGFLLQRDPAVKAPKNLEPNLTDVTPRGNVPLAGFATQAAGEIVEVGRVGILVDVPKDVPTGGTARPYCVLYKAEDILSTKLERRGADEVLCRVVLREYEDVPDPQVPDATRRVERFRVLELADGVYTQTEWRFVRSGDSGAESLVAGEPIVPVRRGQPLDFLPFLIATPSGVSPDMENPPLLDLADVNLGHWRNSVDYENGLHLVALPQPYISGQLLGGGATDAAEPLRWGPSVIFQLEKDSTVGLAEFSGQGLAAIKEAMEEKKRQMATLGARILEDSGGAAETATAVSMRHAGEQASMRRMAGSISQALTAALRWMGWWVGIDADPSKVEASCELNKDFFQVKASPEEIKTAFLLWQGEGISKETFFDRIQKGGWAREGVTFEDEQAAIEHGAGGMSVGGGDGSGEGDGDGDAGSGQGASGKPPAVTPAGQKLQTSTETVLNGAQVTAATAIVVAVTKGEIPRDSGLAQLRILFNLSEQQATEIMGSAGTERFTPASAGAGAGGGVAE